MNVLIISEDFRIDQHILKPIIGRMFQEVGKPRAKILMAPLQGGIDQATSWETIQDTLDKYRGMVDVFLLVVDRDGLKTRRKALDVLERRTQTELDANRILLAENAWQEIEVWALAGQDLPKKWSWSEIRSEVHPKEMYFVPWAERRGLLEEPGQGRITMGREAAANYKRVLSLCHEDLESLQKRLKSWLDR